FGSARVGDSFEVPEHRVVSIHLQLGTREASKHAQKGRREGRGAHRGVGATVASRLLESDAPPPANPASRADTRAAGRPPSAELEGLLLLHGRAAHVGTRTLLRARRGVRLAVVDLLADDGRRPDELLLCVL